MMTLSAFVVAALPRGLVGLENVVEVEAMRDEQLRVDLVGRDRLEENRNRHRIDQARGDGDIAIPESPPDGGRPFSPCTPICDVATGRDDFFAELECDRNADRFDGGIDAARSPVIRMTASAALPSELLMVEVAPKRLATSRRLSSRSIMMICAGE